MRPVTQTADTAVKKASIKDSLGERSGVEIGSINKTVPIAITNKNDKVITSLKLILILVKISKERRRFWYK